MSIDRLHPQSAERLAALCKARREALGWTQDRVAATAGISRVTYTRIEGAQSAFPVRCIAHIADAIGLSAADVSFATGLSVAELTSPPIRMSAPIWTTPLLLTTTTKPTIQHMHPRWIDREYWTAVTEALAA